MADIAKKEYRNVFAELGIHQAEVETRLQEIIRFYFYGEKTSALASAYHMTDAAVRLRLHRSRGKLRKQMTERGFDNVE